MSSTVTWTQAYNPAAASEHYVGQGYLSESEFEELLLGTLRIREMNLPQLDWLLFDHALSVYRSIPLLAHFEAAAKGLDIPFRGIRSLYEHMISIGLLPPRTLNRTTLYLPPGSSASRLGELMVSTGVLADVALERSLEIAELIREKTGIRAAVGQIFRTVGGVSVCDFFQVLGIQVGIPFKSLDASAPRIFEVAMER